MDPIAVGLKSHKTGDSWSIKLGLHIAGQCGPVLKGHKSLLAHGTLNLQDAREETGELLHSARCMRQDHGFAGLIVASQPVRACIGRAQISARPGTCTALQKH